jgi:DNA-directed RNA polymerase subunit RPC12/RpoP
LIWRCDDDLSELDNLPFHQQVTMRGHDFFQRHGTPPKSGLFVGLVFGLVFLGIGITVIVWMWTAEGFGAPPLVFRIFATFIAIAFVAMGGATAYSAARALAGGQVGFHHDDLPARLQDQHIADNAGTDTDRTAQVGYICPGCGAPLTRGADVSPHGDVKCAHCGRWFNVHKSNR